MQISKFYWPLLLKLPHCTGSEKVKQCKLWKTHFWRKENCFCSVEHRVVFSLKLLDCLHPKKTVCTIPTHCLGSKSCLFVFLPLCVCICFNEWWEQSEIISWEVVGALVKQSKSANSEKLNFEGKKIVRIQTTMFVCLFVCLFEHDVESACLGN